MRITPRDSESDQTFRDWLLASFPPISDDSGVVTDGVAVDQADLETMLTSHGLFRRLLEAVLACQRAAQVHVPERALDGDIEHKDSAFDQAYKEEFSASGAASQELSAFLMNYCDVLEDIASQLTNAHETINQICEKQQESFMNLSSGISKGQSVLRTETTEPAVRMRYRSAIRELKTELVNKRKRGRLPAESTMLLTAWWSEHERWPYPTETEKGTLCASTGLNAVQLNNWFINRRKRQWSKALEDA